MNKVGNDRGGHSRPPLAITYTHGKTLEIGNGVSWNNLEKVRNSLYFHEQSIRDNCDEGSEKELQES